MYLRICPWGRICQREPPLLSMSGAILFRGLLEMILAMLAYHKKSCNAILFSAVFRNGRHENIIWTIYPVLLDIYTYVFRVKELNEKHYFIPIWQIRKNER